MKFLSSLDAKARKLLLWCVGIGLALAVLTGFLLPGANDNNNPLPSSYLSGQHGARAAYETLLRSSYSIERWERPLPELAAEAGPSTVVIFAQPFTREPSDIKAIRTILDRGGRVLSTGFSGGFILPGEATAVPTEFNFAACQLQPEGLDSLSNSGEVWMVPQAAWNAGNPAHRIEYSCAGQPAVVEYDWKKGHVVWWASSTPLENGSIQRAENLNLFLNSLGASQNHHFYWDESLHGEVYSDWYFASGAALNLLKAGLLGIALLVIFSFSRRRGPVRDLPAPVRATPVEFLEALGSLYAEAGASATSVDLAYERFRRHMGDLCGLKGAKMSAEDLGFALRRRFPQALETLEKDLAECEQAIGNDTLQPKKALALVQALSRHGEALDRAARARTYD